MPKGRRGEVDEHCGLLAHQLFNRIDRVQAARPEVLVIPGVLADGDGQPEAVQLDHLLRLRRGKVALFVEDIVEGQQALVLFEKQAAAVEKNGGVNGRLSTLALSRQSHTCQHSGGQFAGGRG